MQLLGIIGPFQIAIMLSVIFVLMLIPVIALVDIVRSKFEGNDKLIWVLIVLFLNIIGTILYFLVGRNQKIR